MSTLLTYAYVPIYLWELTSVFVFKEQPTLYALCLTSLWWVLRIKQSKEECDRCQEEGTVLNKVAGKMKYVQTT